MTCGHCTAAVTEEIASCRCPGGQHRPERRRHLRRARDQRVRSRRDRRTRGRRRGGLRAGGVMSRAAALRLGAFAGALALAFGAAFAIGSAVDPIAAADPAPAQAHGTRMGWMAAGSRARRGRATARARGVRRRLHVGPGDDVVLVRREDPAAVHDPGPRRQAGHAVHQDAREGPAPDRGPARPVRLPPRASDAGRGRHLEHPVHLHRGGHLARVRRLPAGRPDRS